jgi:hypothetical protein
MAGVTSRSVLGMSSVPSAKAVSVIEGILDLGTINRLNFLL